MARLSQFVRNNSKHGQMTRRRTPTGFTTRIVLGLARHQTYGIGVTVL